MLHQLLELGALILKPNLHLQTRTRQGSASRYGLRYPLGTTHPRAQRPSSFFPLSVRGCCAHCHFILPKHPANHPPPPASLPATVTHLHHAWGLPRRRWGQGEDTGEGPAQSELYLSLGESQRRCELGSFGESQVLSLLEPPVQSLQLQTGINSPGFADFFPFPIKANFPSFYHSAFLRFGPYKPQTMQNK